MAARAAKAYGFFMAKQLSIALLVSGAVLLLYGLHTGDSLAPAAGAAVTGQRLILIATGLASLVAGGTSSFFRRPN